ncbi:NLR family CARD domain-containing protein 3 [Genypterus blacodes]|uniref:NLR family CARD domain-containing protein 3 n=1 Tax=Genypterus blacodes TaxID=154954 RepID=UPI003F76ACB7
MDDDAEVPRVLNHGDEGERRPGGEEKEERKRTRPPSSYGSMKSDSDEREYEVEDEDDEEDCVDCTFPDTFKFESPAPAAAGFQPPRSASPETLYTMTTQLTKPPGAMVIHTRAADFLEDDEEKEEEEEDDILYADSPEPPEPVESDEVMQTEDNSQPGRLHPLQDLPHIFKSVLATLRRLTREELFKFKLCFSQWQSFVTVPELMEGDVLDFVDKILEVLGQDCSLLDTLRTLKSVNKVAEAEELRKTCDRAWIRYHLKTYLIRKHEVIHEGIPRPGKRNRLDTIYVQPQISVCGFGGVDPSHQIRPQPPSPLQIPCVDTSVRLNDLFRLRKEDGRPVRTAVTTGIPGIGMTVSVGKFCLDWAELRANRNLQFIIKLPFHSFWRLRDSPPPSKMMSIMEVIEYHHLECKDMKCLEEADCKFLIIMDSFDCYQATLDWENSPVLTDSHAPAHPDVLIVNLIRGNLLPGAFVWILGRRAAVSQIPAELIDVVTEIQGFSDEMKDDYLTRRFTDGALAANIVAHYQRLPMLRMLCRQPFICWMVATLFENSYRYVGYGVKPPKLTPFYINILVVQTNRKLQFYYNQTENNLKWSSKDKDMLMQMGKMALMMLEKNSSVFFEEDLKEQGLKLTEVTVFSGLCTELPAATSTARRTFCFIHLTYQEFMAALYVFGKFHMESQSKNVLDSMSKTKIFAVKGQSKLAAGLLHSALDRTLRAPLGQYDMFLRFLCGLLCPGCHKTMLEGNLFPHNSPAVAGLGEVQQLLEKTIASAPQERLANLMECLRELTQEDA